MNNFDFLSQHRTDTYDGTVTDVHGFLEGRGAIHLLGESTKKNYYYLLQYMNPESEDATYIRAYADEIIENKWMIHVYDIEGTLK